MGVRLSQRTLVTGANAMPAPAPAWVAAAADPSLPSAPQVKEAGPAPEEVAVAMLGGGIAALFASRRKPAA
jgi:hypothetical protein